LKKPVNKAIILARGLGTRMRSAAADAHLTPEQERIAAAGLKTLMPLVGGRSLLDLIIGQLGKAGFEQVCMVIGPEHDAIREHCGRNGFDVRFGIQEKPLGTADAVLAASDLVDNDELFLVINSDNLYPVEGLKKLREADAPALLAFGSASLVAKSNIPRERIAKFATVETDANGCLSRIVEKPETVNPDSLVSMNAWLFSPAIFDACRAISPSERGEFELTAAVQYAVDKMNERFKAIRIDAGVLDLSNRGDLAGLQVRLAQFDRD
jgi:glucose-1-phosphate thymidylyltransferase